MKKNKKIPQNSVTSKLNETKSEGISKVKAFVKKHLTWVVFGGICAVVSVYFAIRSDIRESEKESARLDIKIGGLSFRNHESILIYYICPSSELKINPIQGALPITFTNKLQYDINNVRVRLRAPLSINDNQKIKTPLSDIHQPKRFFNQENTNKITFSDQAFCTYSYFPQEDCETVDYFLGNIYPGTTITINQNFLIDTLTPYTTTIIEGKPTMVDSWLFYIDCFQSNQTAYSLKVLLAVVDGQKIEDLGKLFDSLEYMPASVSERSWFPIFCPLYYVDSLGIKQLDLSQITVYTGEYLPEKWFRKEKVKLYDKDKSLLMTCPLKDTTLPPFQ